jgi:acetylornithine deacetylase/succinyl-diaminopimelate desuccinylase-like protein
LSKRLGSAIDAVAGKHRCIGAPYGTDAAPLALVGVPSVVFGPGDIAKAHTADEWIELDQLEPAAEILYRLACEE